MPQTESAVDLNSEEGQTLLQELDENPGKFDELDEKTKEAVHAYVESQPDEEDEEKEEVVKKEAAEKAEPEPEPEEVEEKPKKVVPVPKYKEMADKANKYKQKAESAQKKLEQYQRELEEATKKAKVEIKDDDPYDEENFKGFTKDTVTNIAHLQAKVDFLAQKLAERTQEDATHYSNLHQEAAEKGVYEEIGHLQERFPDLKTDTPFSRLDNMWRSHLNDLVKVAGFGEDFQLTQSEMDNGISLEEKKMLAVIDMNDNDPVFRKKAKDFGVELPDALKDEKEWNKYQLLAELNASKRNQGGSLKSHYLDYLDNKGHLEDYISKSRKEAALEASEKTAKAIENNSPETLNPSDGSSKEEKQKLTLESAGAILNDLELKAAKRPLTPEDEALGLKVHKFLEKELGLLQE